MIRIIDAILQFVHLHQLVLDHQVIHRLVLKHQALNQQVAINALHLHKVTIVNPNVLYVHHHQFAHVHVLNRVLQVLQEHQVHRVKRVQRVNRVHQVNQDHQVNQVAMVKQVHQVHRVHVVQLVHKVHRVNVYHVLYVLNLQNLVHHVQLFPNLHANMTVFHAILVSMLIIILKSLSMVSNEEVAIVHRSVSRVPLTHRIQQNPTKAIGCRILNLNNTKYFYRLIFN